MIQNHRSDEKIALALPESWRARLLLTPEGRITWLKTISDLGIRVMDWNDQVPDRIIVAELDPSTAEIILKLPGQTESVLVSKRIRRSWNWGLSSTRSLEKRALQRPNLTLVPFSKRGNAEKKLFENPHEYLTGALEALK